MMIRLYVFGTIIHAPVCGEIEVLKNTLIVIDEVGEVAQLYCEGDDNYEDMLYVANQSGCLTKLKAGQFLLPGMVDLHVHAPQWPQLGKALHLPLYDWLQQCTFPLEAKYSDVEFAEKVYSSLVDTLIANGTTTALYFATIHLEATKLLADICLKRGQRALVGKVAMDNNDQCPEFYRDRSTQAGLDETMALIDYIRNMPGNKSQRILPVVTPRFIPSCTDEMLKGLGEIAQQNDCHVQTHCSESDWEHNYVIARHGVSDTKSLRQFGLLTDKTILAHSNFISQDDMAEIKDKQSGIAHCPLSNVYFSNAVFPARKALEYGLDVGLGTDISAGASPSLLHNCSAAITSSRVLEGGVDADINESQRGVSDSRIDFKQAFWMATTGGGRALGLDIGLIEKGYAFDAIVVDTTVADSNLQLWDESGDVEGVLQQIIYNADRKNITKVWVQGTRVK